MSLKRPEAYTVHFDHQRGYLVANALTKDMQYLAGHIHSNIDDGRMSPGKIVEEALKAGIEFIAVTDHDNIAGSEAVAKYISDNGHDAKVQAVLGSEITTLEGGHEGHLLALGIKHNIGEGPLSIEETVDKIHEDGGVAIIPHMDVPRADSIRSADVQVLWNKSSYPPDGIEVFNGSVETLHKSRLTRRLFPEDYNARAGEFLLRLAEDGVKVAPFGGSDNHRRRFGRTVLTGFSGGDPVEALAKGETIVVVDSRGFGLVDLAGELCSRSPIKKEITRMKTRVM